MPWVEVDRVDDSTTAVGDRQPASLPGLLVLSEVARYLRKSDRTIRRWINAGGPDWPGSLCPRDRPDRPDRRPDHQRNRQPARSHARRKGRRLVTSQTRKNTTTRTLYCRQMKALFFNFLETDKY